MPARNPKKRKLDNIRPKEQSSDNVVEFDKETLETTIHIADLSAFVEIAADVEWYPLGTTRDGSEVRVRIHPRGNKPEKYPDHCLGVFVLNANKAHNSSFEFKILVCDGDQQPVITKSSNPTIKHGCIEGWGRPCLASKETALATKAIDLTVSTTIYHMKTKIRKPEVTDATREQLHYHLQENMKTLKKSSFCDYTLRADGKNIAVHSEILAKHSPVFAASLKSGLKESKDRCTEIQDCSELVVQRFVDWCYNGTLPELSVDSMFALFSLSHRYQVDKLQKVLSGKLQSELVVSNCVRFARLADM